MGFRNHTLEVGGTTRTLAAWGVVEAVHSEGTGPESQLVLVVAAQLDAAPLWSYGDRCKLYDATGALRFIGYLQVPTPTVDAGAERWVYTFLGPEYDLDVLPYKQHWRFPEDIEDSESENYEELVSLVNLNRHYDTGAKVTLKAQVEDALDQACNVVTRAALDLDVDQAARLTYDTTGVPLLDPPESEERDQSVLDVLHNQSRWHPSGFWRIKYTGGAAKLVFCSVQTLDVLGRMLDVPAPVGEDVQVRQLPVNAFSAFDPKPLSDRLVRKLTFVYLYTGVDSSGDNPFYYRQCFRDSSTVENGARGEREMTVELRGPMWDGENFTNPEARPADGLAKELHQAFARVWWKFEFTVAEQDVIWSWTPGDLWNVSGSATSHATAFSVAQKIVRDIGRGTTTVSTGAPGHLGLGDWFDILKGNRLRNYPRNAGAQTSGKPEQKPDGGDLHTFYVVENGGGMKYKIRATADGAF